MHRSHRPILVAAAVGVGLALLATGCGGAPSGGPSVAAAGTGTAAARTTSTAAKADPVAFSRCMRAHGVPSFPDPDSEGRIEIRATPGSPLAPDSPTFKAAQQACRRFAPARTADPGALRKMADQALKFSACMRSHGVPKFPDPKVSGDGIQIAIRGIDPTSPAFKAAQQACRAYSPGAAGGPDGAPGKASVGGS